MGLPGSLFVWSSSILSRVSRGSGRREFRRLSLHGSPEVSLAGHETLSEDKGGGPGRYCESRRLDLSGGEVSFRGKDSAPRLAEKPGFMTSVRGAAAMALCVSQGATGASRGLDPGSGRVWYCSGILRCRSRDLTLAGRAGGPPAVLLSRVGEPRRLESRKGEDRSLAWSGAERVSGGHGRHGGGAGKALG